MDAKGNTEKVKHVVYIPDDAIRAERRKLRFVVIAFICLLVVLLGISLFAIYKSTVAERVAGSSSEMPVKDDERIHNSFKHRSDFKPMEEEHIEVVGDGIRFLSLQKGSNLCHWMLSTQSGGLRLKHHTFITIQVPGLYRVYGQYAVYQPSGQETKFVSVMLMRNRTALSTSIVEKCRRLCTGSFAKTVRLRMGDKLSLQSGTGGTFMVSSKHSYFGANILQSSVSV